MTGHATRGGASAAGGPRAAGVEILTAEVRALMIGSRQVTLSVYRQLDHVPHGSIEPFGRVRDSQDKGDGIFVVGKDVATGALVRSKLPKPRVGVIWTASGTPWLRLGRRHVRYHNDYEHNARYIELQFGSEFGWKHYRFRDSDPGILIDDDNRDAPPELLIDPDDFRAQVDDPRDALEAAWRRYRQWEALPLIVLAGLR